MSIRVLRLRAPEDTLSMKRVSFAASIDGHLTLWAEETAEAVTSLTGNLIAIDWASYATRWSFQE